MKVLVLGAGKMTEAFLFGLASGGPLKDWGIYSPSGTSARGLAEKVGASHVKDLDEVKSPSWILIGCKPQQLPSLKETLGGRFQDALFLSLLAAVSEGDQRRVLGISRLARVMPNLSVKHGEGVVLLSSESASAEVPVLCKTFSMLGTCMGMKEAELEELTLLTGSGPALFYEFTRSLAAQFSSLDPHTREHLARQVLAGSGMSVRKEGAELGPLIDAVTSKGGVTIAVLEKWRELKLAKLLGQGIEAGKKRTEAIKAQLRASP